VWATLGATCHMANTVLQPGALLEECLMDCGLLSPEVVVRRRAAAAAMAAQRPSSLAAHRVGEGGQGQVVVGGTPTTHEEIMRDVAAIRARELQALRSGAAGSSNRAASDTGGAMGQAEQSAVVTGAGPSQHSATQQGHRGGSRWWWPWSRAVSSVSTQAGSGPGGHTSEVAAGAGGGQVHEGDGDDDEEFEQWLAAQPRSDEGLVVFRG
jgi:hypothetical protein